MQSRREILDALAPHSSTHAGLWLDRFIPTLAKKSEGTARALMEQMLSAIRVPDEYRLHFARWQRELAENPPATLLANATVRGRIVIGLGAESVLETSMALHRTYGVPLIPGSSLKGLASAAAHAILADDGWRKPTKATEDRPATPAGESHLAMFGEIVTAGHVTFHDALWIPDGETALPIDLDVMTVHHAAYYAGKDVPAADTDSPNPVSFLTARGTYLLALTGPPRWIDAAMHILKIALDTEGIGAKTAAGYGRMDVDFVSSAERQAREASALAEEQARAARARADREARNAARIAGLQKSNAANEVRALLATADGKERRELARRIVQELRRRFKKWLDERRDKAWAKELLEAAGEDD